MSSDIYQRLRDTATFRDGAFARWETARIGIVGCGAIGSRYMQEAVRSGVGQVWACDFEHTSPHNLATQAVRPGMFKVDSIVRDCDQIRPGAASGVRDDIRHVGIGVLRRCDVLVDLTDDARLAYPLTEIANGLGAPLLRAAVDGSGRYELGRVLCSDARDGGSCQVCTQSWSDLAAGTSRTPCPGAATAARPATRAGGALAGVVAGVALLQTQRLVAGRDMELVRDREVIVDLSHFQIMSALVRRSERCISGHLAWELIDVPAAQCACLNDVYAAAADFANDDTFTVEPYAHAYCIEAGCACGATSAAVGTVWAAPPTCQWCGDVMFWRTATQIAALRRTQADALGILQRSFVELGLPERGAMFVVRVPNRPARRLILNDEPSPAK